MLDVLAIVNLPLNDDEFVSYLLGGLDSSYCPLITSITIRVDLLTLEDIPSHLLSFELRLDEQIAAIDMAVSLANVATRSDVSQNRGSFRSSQ